MSTSTVVAKIKSSPRRAQSTPEAKARLSVLHLGKFYSPCRGGMENHLETLCLECRPYVDLNVIVAAHQWTGGQEVVGGVPVTRSTNWMNIAGASVCPTMALQIRNSPADLVHIHHPNPTAMIAYLSSGHKGKLVLTYHSDIVRQRTLGRAFQPILNRVLDQCGAIIVTSPHYLETSPVLAMRRSKCHVIPFGIRVDGIQSDHSAVAARIRAHYGPRIVLAVGRLVYYKGFQYLVRAMQNVDATLLIVGSGPLRQTLEREAAMLGLQGKVRLLGEVEDVAPYYQACDLFVLPSTERSEAFGLVQLEAMACGKPVVNTWLQSGVPFVSLDGITGLTVRPADPAALAGAIGKLLADDALRSAYGAAALRRVEKDFSLATMTLRTLAVYNEVLAARSR